LHDALEIYAAKKRSERQDGVTTTMQYKGVPKLREAPSIEDVYAKIEQRNPGWTRPSRNYGSDADDADRVVITPAVSKADSTVVKPIISDSAIVQRRDSSVVQKPDSTHGVDKLIQEIKDTTQRKSEGSNGKPVTSQKSTSTTTTKQPAAQPATQKPATQQSSGPSFSDWMRAQVKAGNYNTVQEWNGKKYHIKYGDEAMHNKAMAKLGANPYGRTAEQHRRIESNEDWNGGK
jgi:hypothetical protein